MNKRIISAIVFLLALVCQVSAEDRVTVKDFSISAGETKTISIELANDVVYAAFQFDLYLPEGITVESSSLDYSRVPKGTTLTMSKQWDGSYRFISAAMSQEPMVGNSGDIVSVTVKATENLAHGETTGFFSNVKLSKLDGTGSTYNKMTFPITVIEPSVVTVISCSREYGDANPTFEYTVSGGALEGEPAISCEATVTSPVGEYPVTIVKGSISNPNVTFVAGTLTISKAPLTVTAKDYTIKQGEALPAFEATYSGFKNSETSEVLAIQPSFSCSGQVGSAPGSYDINVSGAESGNYSFIYVKGTLTVTDADPVTITAKSYEIYYGDALPEYGFSSSGAALSGTPAISCTATSASPVGTYPITISKGSVTNYNDTYVNGTLTINKAPLTIKADTYTRKQGEDNPEFTLTYDGFKNEETEDVLTKKPTATTTATKESLVGDYLVTVSGAEAENYDISYIYGMLTVEQFLGDANGDGVLDEKDVKAVTDYIMKGDTENFIFMNADVKTDSIINVADIVRILNMIKEAKQKKY